MHQKNSVLLLTTLAMASIAVTACSTTVPVQNEPVPLINQFQAVWNEVTTDPLDELPHVEVSFWKLFANGKNIILGDSKRTLEEHANILQPFEKLAHPNGICFKGVWNIDVDNKYSGYFKLNSEALIIVRASAAMSNTRRGELRSFGFAGKLFPTMNPMEVVQEHSANFFLIDDLGGTRAEHYTDVSLTNEPSASKTSEVFKSLLYVLKLARAFSLADENPGIRQVYEISQLGEINNEAAITPRWMKLEAQPGQTVDAIDFRDELLIAGNQKLVFAISVASEQTNDQKDWQTIGNITLDTSVVSASCDHRLHFHHPVWNSSLNH